MRRRTKYALAFALALALTAGVAGAGWALPDNPLVSLVTFGDPVMYSNQLTANVSHNPDGSHHYAYTLVYGVVSDDEEPLADFSVGNLLNLPSTNWGSDASDYVVDSSGDSFLWYIGYGAVPVGSTVHFWYDSSWSYGLVDVTVAGSLPSSGQTLGMVPEPGSLLAVAFGLGGVLWTRLRRRS